MEKKSELAKLVAISCFPQHMLLYYTKKINLVWLLQAASVRGEEVRRKEGRSARDYSLYLYLSNHSLHNQHTTLCATTAEAATTKDDRYENPNDMVLTFNHIERQHGTVDLRASVLV